MSPGLQATIAGVFAGVVGIAELVSRYRSEPTKALSSPSAWLYVGLNAAAGVGALYLVRAFGWTFGQETNVDLWRVLVAGFGSLALFRSSFFVAKIGGSSVGVGPSVALEQLLGAFDRDVDRKCAGKISQDIKQDTLSQLDPASVASTLPVLCLALMQNFPPSDQALLAADVAKTQQDGNLSAAGKTRIVVLQLAKYLGTPLVTQVLEDGKAIFGDAHGEKDAVLEATKTIPSRS